MASYYLKSFFLLLFLISAALSSAQHDEICSCEQTRFHAVPTYTLGDDVYEKEPLFLSNKMENFDYKGKFACSILIDTLEKRIVQVDIIFIQISNGQDSICVYSPERGGISEYSGKYSNIIHKIHPFMKNHVFRLNLIKNRNGTPECLGRYYYYSHIIKVE